MLGLLRRNLRSAPKNTKELGYKALVRPILEYARSVWDPYEEKDIQKIEKVQRRAARFVLNRYKQTDSVTAMLKDLGWQTLKDRRKKARLCMMHKINSGQVHIKFERLKKLDKRSGRRKGNSEMFERVVCRRNYRNETFLPKTIREWNELPDDIVQSTSLGSFSLKVSKML